MRKPSGRSRRTGRSCRHRSHRRRSGSCRRRNWSSRAARSAPAFQPPPKSCRASASRKVDVDPPPPSTSLMRPPSSDCFSSSRLMPTDSQLRAERAVEPRCWSSDRASRRRSSAPPARRCRSRPTRSRRCGRIGGGAPCCRCAGARSPDRRRRPWRSGRRPLRAPLSRRSIALAPSAKPKATAVLSSILATAEPATSCDLRASSGPMPIRSSAKPWARSCRSRTVIAMLSGPACALVDADVIVQRLRQRLVELGAGGASCARFST